MKIQEKAILVSLTIKRWHGTKFDKKTTKEVDRTHGAINAGRYTKYLIAKTGLEGVSTMESRIRNYHYKMTYPWGDNKDRLLPNTKYFEYMEEMRTLKDEYIQEAEKFILAFPDLKEEAKVRMNGLYNESEYPSIEDLRSMFDVKVAALPIQSSDDFRINLQNDEVEALKAEMEEEIKQRQKAAIGDLLSRVHDAVSKMGEKLHEGGVFRNTLVTNIENLLNIVPELNVTGDLKIHQIVEEVKELLVSPELLRSSTMKRRQTADRATELAEKLAFFNQGD